jgi:hypothetical protein
LATTSSMGTKNSSGEPSVGLALVALESVMHLA